jgi:hypothetical protein
MSLYGVFASVLQLGELVLPDLGFPDGLCEER